MNPKMFEALKYLLLKLLNTSTEANGLAHLAPIFFLMIID